MVLRVAGAGNPPPRDARKTCGCASPRTRRSDPVYPRTNRLLLVGSARGRDRQSLVGRDVERLRRAEAAQLLPRAVPSADDRAIAIGADRRRRRDRPAGLSALEKGIAQRSTPIPASRMQDIRTRRLQAPSVVTDRGGLFRGGDGGWVTGVPGVQLRSGRASVGSRRRQVQGPSVNATARVQCALSSDWMLSE